MEKIMDIYTVLFLLHLVVWFFAMKLKKFNRRNSGTLMDVWTLVVIVSVPTWLTYVITKILTF